MYWTMSALSTKAPSMAPVMLEVVNINTFGAILIWSSCVSSAFTTLRVDHQMCIVNNGLILHLMASLGSDPEAFLAAVSDSTSSMRTQTRDLSRENQGFVAT